MSAGRHGCAGRRAARRARSGGVPAASRPLPPLVPCTWARVRVWIPSQHVCQAGAAVRHPHVQHSARRARHRQQPRDGLRARRVRCAGLAGLRLQAARMTGAPDGCGGTTHMLMAGPGRLHVGRAAASVARRTCEAPPPKYSTMRTGVLWIRSTIISISDSMPSMQALPTGAAAADGGTVEPARAERAQAGYLSAVRGCARRVPRSAAPRLTVSARRSPPFAATATALPRAPVVIMLAWKERGGVA